MVVPVPTTRVNISNDTRTIMKQEDKEILLKDLCARLPYAPKGVYSLKCDSMHPITFDRLTTKYIDRFTTEQPSYTDEIVDIKLYLRPMSSMTSEEKEEYDNLLMSVNDGCENTDYMPYSCTKYVDWLNAHHFDYRGLIEKGLALPAPEGMYK